MIGNDIKVSDSGTVTGTIKYLSSVPGYDGGQDSGHYFPIMFESKNYKPLHVGGKVVDGQFVAGKEITPSEKDPYLVIRVENCTDGKKITVYDNNTKAELFTLDFNKATLEQQPTKINANVKTPIAKVQASQDTEMKSLDEPIETETETQEEKHYTKSEIQRMSTADLQALAAEKGVENAGNMTGTELKTLLIDMLIK